MAYASLLSLAQTIDQILQSHDEEQLFLHKEKLQLRSLRGKIPYLLSYLEDSSTVYSETVSSSEGRIRDVTYEAEDLIESHITKQIKSYMTEPILFRGVVRCFREIIDHSARCLGSTRQNFEEKLENVIQKINLISEVEKMEDLQTSNFIQHPPNLERTEAEVKMHPRNSSRATPSKSASSNKSDMVGFEEDMLRIKDFLTGPPYGLETTSIVGMGGIGKTTLARNIYNDPLVNRRFDIKAWTTVSLDYNVKSLLEDLLDSMGNPTPGASMEDLALKLYRTLKMRRYLIVMDDVWDSRVLEELRRIFPDDNVGSRLIITSRSSYVGGPYNSHIHRLNFFSPDKSWNLLCQKAFGEEGCPIELEDIGRKIAENCKGLPLSLVMVGSILQKAERTPQRWDYIAKNLKSADDNLMQILSLSYNQLSHRMRTCFLYMGVFPKDTIIRVSHLIMLWVANGFIKPRPTRTLEDVAMEHLEDLAERNLVIVHERKACGEMKTCVVSSHFRDLCIKKAEEEKFLVVEDSGTEISLPISRTYRHLIITDESMRLGPFEDIYDSTFRSILCFGGRLENMHFQLLKVFDARETIFDRFPNELLQLVNLKYIALVCFKTSEIPSSITKLRNLQTLLVFISSRDGKIILPSEILNMPQLRHLWVEGGILHHSSDGQNENLQTICGVRNFILTEKGIGMFPNLKTLGLTYDKTEWGSSGLENLVHLYRLELLKLRIDDAFLELPFGTDLSFPVSLRKLSLRGFRLSQEQMSMIGSLPNLEVLKLKYVEFDKEEGWKISEAEFPELKFLLLRRPNKFSWDLEETAFPSLECLTLDGMYDLDCLPSEIGEIPTLRDINLYNCPSSLVDSARHIQEELSFGNYDFQIRVYSGDVYKLKFMDYMLYGR